MMKFKISIKTKFYFAKKYLTITYLTVMHKIKYLFALNKPT